MKKKPSTWFLSALPTCIFKIFISNKAKIVNINSFVLQDMFVSLLAKNCFIYDTTKLILKNVVYEPDVVIKS